MLNKFSIPLTPTLISAASAPSGGKFELVLDMRNCKYKRLLLMSDWLYGTSASTGLQLSVLPGFGPANKLPADIALLKFATNDATVVYQPDLAQPPPGLGAAAEGVNVYNTFISLDYENNSRFPKLAFQNLDQTYPLQLTIWGDE